MLNLLFKNKFEKIENKEQINDFIIYFEKKVLNKNNLLVTQLKQLKTVMNSEFLDEEQYNKLIDLYILAKKGMSYEYVTTRVFLGVALKNYFFNFDILKKLIDANEIFNNESFETLLSANYICLDKDNKIKITEENCFLHKSGQKGSIVYEMLSYYEQLTYNLFDTFELLIENENLDTKMFLFLKENKIFRSMLKYQHVSDGYNKNANFIRLISKEIIDADMLYEILDSNDSINDVDEYKATYKYLIEYGFYKYNMSFEQFNLFLGFIYNKECDSYIDYLSMLIHYFNSSNFKNKSHDEVAHIIKEIKEKLLPIDTYSIENIISKEKNLLITLNKKGFESYKEAYNVIFYKTMQTENFSKEEKIKLFFNDNISFVLDDYENNNNINANVIKENQLYQSLLKLIKFDIDCYKIKNKKTEKTFTYEYLEKITSNLNDFILFSSTKNEYTEIIKRLLDEVLFHKQNLVKSTKSKKIPLI